MQQVNIHFKQRVLLTLFLEHNAAVAKYKQAKAQSCTSEHGTLWLFKVRHQVKNIPSEDLC